MGRLRHGEAVSGSADRRQSLSPEGLAHALDVELPVMDRVLAEVGVDADYLVRALYEGDPQGAFPAVARRLDVEKPDVVVAVVKALVNAGRLDARGVPRVLDAAFRHVQDADVVRARVDLARASRGLDGAGVPAPPLPASPTPAEDEAVARFLGEALPRFVRRARLGATVLGVAVLALGIIGFADPALFRATVWVLAAGALVLAGVLLLAVAWRLHGAVRALGAFAGTFSAPRN